MLVRTRIILAVTTLLVLLAPIAEARPKRW
jgi:hypothetical protein